ncbi:MAG: SHOCT domain-containing protein [Alphaproteobacteria bacterium]|nr:SHOCT domain-containing protein [Alphaproteobacteria bacterium]
MPFFSGLWVAALFILVLIVLVLLVQIPIAIARNRGITGGAFIFIVVLSWLGILCGVTWVIALLLSLVLGGTPGQTLADVDRLDKLHKLKKAGVITQKEFDREKQRILG